MSERILRRGSFTARSSMGSHNGSCVDPDGCSNYSWETYVYLVVFGLLILICFIMCINSCVQCKRDDKERKIKKDERKARQREALQI